MADATVCENRAKAVPRSKSVDHLNAWSHRDFAAHQAAEALASGNEASCRGCSGVISLRGKGLFQAFCLKCAERKTTEALAKAQVAHDQARASEFYSKDCQIASLSEEVTILETSKRRLKRAIDDMEYNLECQRESNENEITVLKATLRRKEAAMWDNEAAWERKKQALEREDEELRQTHTEHLRTCPAPKNRLMLEQGGSTTFADVCVAAGGTVFHVHRAILASRSSVFASILNLCKSGHTPIQIGDMSARALEQFLFFLYTGRFREGFDAKALGAEVMEAAHKYNVADMEETLRTLTR